MSTAVGSSRARGAGARSGERLRPPTRPTPRARLRPVAPAAAQPRSSAFVVLLVLVLGGGMVGLLVLNTAMQRSAFELEGLRARSAVLDVRSQVLDLQVQRLRAPDRLARRATELGLVTGAATGFVDLADDTVLGAPRPAVAGTGPDLVPTRPARSLAEPVRSPAAPARAERPDTRPDSRPDTRGDTPRQDPARRRAVPQNEPQQSQQSQRPARASTPARGEGGRR